MRTLALVASLGPALACGSSEPVPLPDAPASAPPPQAAPADPEPAPAGPSKADAERTVAHTWWRRVALGEIEGAEIDGDDSYARIGGGDPQATDGGGAWVVCATADLVRPGARDAGYREAVDVLVRSLRDERGRSDATLRLEVLTKTQRGAWENWIAWHEQHGDFLVYNAELDRVDVDEARMKAGRAAVVGGLSLDVRLASDRIGQDDPLALKVRLRNVTSGDEATPIVVNQRLALGHELAVELFTQAAESIDEIPLRPPADPPAIGPDDFATLEPGKSLDLAIDLAPKLAGPLAPGRYMVRLTYRNGACDAAASGCWTGEVASLRRYVRVVPW